MWNSGYWVRGQRQANAARTLDVMAFGVWPHEVVHRIRFRPAFEEVLDTMAFLWSTFLHISVARYAERLPPESDAE